MTEKEEYERHVELECQGYVQHMAGREKSQNLKRLLQAQCQLTHILTVALRVQKSMNRLQECGVTGGECFTGDLLNHLERCGAEFVELARLTDGTASWTL